MQLRFTDMKKTNLNVSIEKCSKNHIYNHKNHSNTNETAYMKL